MTASPMHWTKPNGDPVTYTDGQNTPVPRRTYRCPATAAEQSPNNVNLQRKHTCKITVDHDGDLLCLCGQKWGRKEA